MARMQLLAPQAAVLNLWGCTEAAADSTCWQLPADGAPEATEQPGQPSGRAVRSGAQSCWSVVCSEQVSYFNWTHLAAEPCVNGGLSGAGVAVLCCCLCVVACGCTLQLAEGGCWGIYWALSGQRLC